MVKTILKRMRLGQKLMILMCIILLSIFTILNGIVLNNAYSYSHNQAKTIALLTSKDNADKVTLNFENIKTIGNSIAIQMETMIQEGNPSREIVLSTMKNTLNLHKDIFGVAITYEPNAFDGKDIEYINKEGNDSKGQFMPYITRKGDNSFTIELCFYDYYNEYQQKWYMVPKNTHKIYLTEPTSYLVQGENMTLVSVVVPIMRNDKFVGVVSIDTNIDFLQTEIEKIKPMGGYSQIISSEGILVANGADPSKVLYDISKKEEWMPILEKTSTGKEFTEIGISSETGEKILSVFSSIHVEGTDEYWTYVSIIPYSHIFAEYNFTFKLMVIVGLILFSLIIYTNYSIITRDL